MTTFKEGRQAGMDEIASGDIYDVSAAIKSFDNDRPDSEWMWGYYSALHDMIVFDEIENYETPDVRSETNEKI